jgi:hypothetical protein
MADDDRSLDSPPPRTPVLQRRTYSTLTFEDTTPSSIREGGAHPDETSSLLEHGDGHLGRSYHSLLASGGATPRPQRQHSYNKNARLSRHHSRNNSLHFSQRLVNALRAESVREPDSGLGMYLY